MANTLITLKNASLAFGDYPLLDNTDFSVQEGERIGLIGRNGTGKSSMLQVLARKSALDDGEIQVKDGLRVVLLEQEPVFPPAPTIRESLIAQSGFDPSDDKLYWKQIAKLDAYLQRLNVRADADPGTASGGERKKAAIALVLAQEPDLLLLDEPTNHLDIESIQWLEEYLKNYNGAVLLISHDRAFLDNVTNRTVELSLGKITDYKVPYSKYVVLRAERRAQQLAAYENQQRMIEKTEEFIEKFRYKPTKSNQVQSRIKQLERLERLEVEEEDLATLNIKFPPAPRSGQIVAEINEAGMSFGSKHVFSGANFTIEKGDRIAFVGRNGEGKTTLARMLVGQLTPTEGSIRIGANVNIGYYAQNQDDLMDGEFTVYDTLDRVAVGDIRTRLRDILGAFLFRGEDIDKKVKVLSGGERARLAMARMMLEPRNLLVLDEPTSFLDIRYKIELSAILLHLAREQGVTIVMSLHEIDLAARVSDLVMGIGAHGVEVFGAPEAVFTEENISRLYGISSGAYDALSGSAELPRAEGQPRMFVLGGMGRATAVYRRLTREGTPFATGILAENDMDIPAARHLAARILTTAPFAPPSEAVLTEARQTLLNCGALLIPDGLEAHAWDDELICFAQEHCVEGRHA